MKTLAVLTDFSTEAKNSFLEKLFNHSHTPRMAAHLRTPLLVYPNTFQPVSNF